MKILAATQSDNGVGKLAAQGVISERGRLFESVLVAGVRELVATSHRNPGVCVVSGMASSNLGWVELPYAQTPLPLCAKALVTKSLDIDLSIPGREGLRVIFASGVQTDRDVMRGEESEILGLTELVSGIRDQVTACLVLPGTHSKHVWIEEGVLVRFSTFMTGELYAHLQSLPTLSKVLSGDEAFSEKAFLAGVDEVRVSGLAAAIFQIRARRILSGFREGLSFLSGLLIGSELMHLHGEHLYLYGSPELAARYGKAGERYGLTFHVLPMDLIGSAVVKAHALVLDEYAFSQQ